MKLETFFDKFELFADAPDAVAKMRELVLEFAVRGRLSERLHTDVTPKEWKAFVDQLGDRGTSKDSGPPFDIPDTWRWITLNELGSTRVRNDVADDVRTSFVPMAMVPARYGDAVATEEKPWRDIKKGFTHFADGDVVMAKITPCFENGKSAVIRGLTNGVGAGTTELHVFRRSTQQVLPEYVFVYIKSRGFITRGESVMTGSAGQKRVPRDYFSSSPFPLPPLAEQKRIVAKVDELMALCDRLEVQRQERETRRVALARASLARFAEAPTPANLEFLFHDACAIPPADLRKSILTLAVQGKLVPQERSDESAEEAVRGVRAKAGLPVKNLSRGSGEPPFALPEGWTWVKVTDVADCRLGKMLDKQKNRGRAYPYLRNTNVHWLYFQLDSIKEMLFDDAELDDYRVEPGDVLICEGGHGIARAAVWEGQIPGIMFQKALHRVRPLPCLNGYFLAFCLRIYEHAGILQRYYTGAGIPHFTGKALAKVTFPLPPLAEQRRIVARVAELTALVDKLEAELGSARTTATHLLAAAVAELTA
ncbi:MAG TPA: restriction endonuclease subunit S [Rhodanobacteraceae bacterium]|nr:restriction endonuclease subunit S [Rhodanobacteraceae bacterium]